MARFDKKLATILARRGLIKEEEEDSLLQKAEESKVSLGTILIQDRVVDELGMIGCIAQEMKLAPIDLEKVRFSIADFTRELMRQWHRFLGELEGNWASGGEGMPSITTRTLLLRTRLPCLNPESFPSPTWLTDADYDEMVDALVASEKPDAVVFAQIYKLHAGNLTARLESMVALGQMEKWTTESVAHLVEELTGEDTRVVQEAITALGMIGPAARDAIPTLEKLAERDDSQIAERAKAALRQVRGR